jgi:hypothetical protein
MIAIDTKTFDKIAEEIFKVFQHYNVKDTYTDDGAKTYASIILNRMNTHTEFDAQDIRYTMKHIVQHDTEVASTPVRKYIAKLI